MSDQSSYLIYNQISSYFHIMHKWKQKFSVIFKIITRGREWWRKPPGIILYTAPLKDVSPAISMFERDSDFTWRHVSREKKARLWIRGKDNWTLLPSTPKGGLNFSREKGYVVSQSEVARQGHLMTFRDDWKGRYISLARKCIDFLKGGNIYVYAYLFGNPIHFFFHSCLLA